MVALSDWSFMHDVLSFGPMKETFPLANNNQALVLEDDVVPDCGSPSDSPISSTQIDDWLHPPSIDPSLTFGPILRTFSSMSVSEERSSSEPFLAIIEEPLDVAAAEAEAEAEDALPEESSLSDTSAAIPSAEVSSIPEEPVVPLQRPVRPQRPASMGQRRSVPPRAKYSRPASVKASVLQATALKPATRAPPGVVGDLPLSEFRSLLEGMSNEEQDRLKHRRRQEKNSSSQRRSRDRKVQDAERANALARKHEAKRRRAAMSNN